MIRQNILIVGFVVLFLMIGLYFAITNYEFLYHFNNVSASPVNYPKANLLFDPKAKCLADGGKWITGWIGGHYSFFCVSG
jgi:hypothetical protein